MDHATSKGDGAKRTLAPLALVILGCGGLSKSDGRAAAGSAGLGVGGSESTSAGAGGASSGGAPLILAGAGYGPVPIGGAQPLGGMTGSADDACSCWSEASCPTLDYLRTACDALMPAEWLGQLWYESCDLTVFELGSVMSLDRFFYDSDGTLVGQRRGDLLEVGLRVGCGIHCAGPMIRGCEVCGDEAWYSRCEP